MKTIELKISGMSCGNCVKHARTALLAVTGVISAEVTLDPAMGVIVADPELITSLLLEALAEEGYVATIN